MGILLGKEVVKRRKIEIESGNKLTHVLPIRARSQIYFIDNIWKPVAWQQSIHSSLLWDLARLALSTEIVILRRHHVPRISLGAHFRVPPSPLVEKARSPSSQKNIGEDEVAKEQWEVKILDSGLLSAGCGCTWPSNLEGSVLGGIIIIFIFQSFIPETYSASSSRHLVEKEHHHCIW